MIAVHSLMDPIAQGFRSAINRLAEDFFPSSAHGDPAKHSCSRRLRQRFTGEQASGGIAGYKDSFIPAPALRWLTNLASPASKI